MYFSKRTYVKNWDFMKPEELHTVIVKKDGKVLPKNKVNPDKVSYIIQEIGYWRKANAIHQWFVNNVQNGEDNCKEHYVEREQIRDLLDRVEKVIAASELIPGTVTNGYNGDGPVLEQGKTIKDPSVAHELLPTTEGFFFGSTDYDEWYLDDIVKTKEILEEALADPEGNYYYDSSW